MKSFVLAAGMAAFFATSAYADNSDAAKGMAEAVSKDRGVTASIAPTVSGNNSTVPGTSGWGNAGSGTLPSGQVSKSGKPD